MKRIDSLVFEQSLCFLSIALIFKADAGYPFRVWFESVTRSEYDDILTNPAVPYGYLVPKEVSNVFYTSFRIEAS
jgi:hypothetical protein